MAKAKKAKKLLGGGSGGPKLPREIRGPSPDSGLVLRTDDGKIYLIPIDVVTQHRRAELEDHEEFLKMLHDLGNRTPGVLNAAILKTIQIMDGGP